MCSTSLEYDPFNCNEGDESKTYPDVKLPDIFVPNGFGDQEAFTSDYFKNNLKTDTFHIFDLFSKDYRTYKSQSGRELYFRLANFSIYEDDPIDYSYQNDYKMFICERWWGCNNITNLIEIKNPMQYSSSY